MLLPPRRPAPARRPGSTARPARSAARPGSALGALGALLALAAVATASAPGVLPIRAGDTLSALAHRYGTTVAALQAANGLTGDRIYAGRTLVLPGAAAAPAAPATPAPTGSPAAAAVRDRATLATRSVLSQTAARALVASTARRYGVDPSLALAVAYQESGFQQRVVSGVDAIGVMQVLPSTARVLSAQVGRPLDLLRTEDNVLAGVLLLRELLRSQSSEHAALAGYYQGVGSIAAQGVLPQTAAYLANIDALRPRFTAG